MNCVTNDPRKSGRRRNHLYDEFAAYYASERCWWAPNDPRRIFNLAFKSIYPTYNRRLTVEQFLALIYDTLGVRQGRPRGLFQKFDPARYTKSLPLEEHFINSFAFRLRGRLKNYLKRDTSHHRVCNPAKLRALLDSKRVRSAQGMPRERELLAALTDALERLEGEEYLVIRLAYWNDLSAREIGLALRRDHKTVRSRLETALSKLRRFLSASGKIFSPPGSWGGDVLLQRNAA
jgi:RNA polymerase sigma factor (sigma-70 family)